MSYDVIVEDVPAFRKRVGDNVVAGSNNAMIVLGTDRPAGPGSGYGHVGAQDDGKGAGTVHIVVGRAGSDPSFADDSAFIYVSMKTDVDANVGTTAIEGATIGSSAVIAKADSVRIVARKDLKIKVGRCYLTMKEDGSIVIDGEVKLGKNAAERLLKGETTVAWLLSHSHTCAVGPTSTPVQPFPQTGFSSRKIKVE